MTYPNIVRAIMLAGIPMSRAREIMYAARRGDDDALNLVQLAVAGRR